MDRSSVRPLGTGRYETEQYRSTRWSGTSSCLRDPCTAGPQDGTSRERSPRVAEILSRRSACSSHASEKKQKNAGSTRIPCRQLLRHLQTACGEHHPRFEGAEKRKTSVVRGDLCGRGRVPRKPDEGAK